MKIFLKLALPALVFSWTITSSWSHIPPSDAIPPQETGCPVIKFVSPQFQELAELKKGKVVTLGGKQWVNALLLHEELKAPDLLGYHHYDHKLGRGIEFAGVSNILKHPMCLYYYSISESIRSYPRSLLLIQKKHYDELKTQPNLKNLWGLIK
tara:strand:+ start:938 stop:1396 length:459 start_codon:yes stop_codon:yes gene_type:complete